MLLAFRKIKLATRPQVELRVRVQYTLVKALLVGFVIHLFEWLTVLPGFKGGARHELTT